MTARPVALTNPPAVHPPAGQYSHVAEVRAGCDLFHFAGQVGARRDGTMADGFAAQVRQAFDNLFALLAANDLTPANILRLTYYLTAPEQADELRAIRRDYLPDPAPATTALVVGLLDPTWLFELDAVAARAPA